MAQTKRKRRTKHRGNAAGMVETRGRTGRKPTSEERKPAAGKGGKRAAPTRAERLDRPPSWKSAFQRAAIATALFFAFVALVFKEPLRTSITISLFMLVLYTPLGYYTDLVIYRRRQRKKLEAGR